MTAPRKETLADGIDLWLGDCQETLASAPIPPGSKIVHSRVGEALKQPDFFIERPQAATQEKLFMGA